MNTPAMPEKNEIICTSAMSPRELDALLDTPHQEVNVVFSLGAKHVEKNLPPLLQVIQNYRSIVRIVFDPFQGNRANPTPDGIFSDALYELRHFMRIAKERHLSVAIDLHENKADQLKPTSTAILQDAFDFYGNVYARHHILS